MAFLTQRRFLGFKKESVRYVPETLLATDYTIPAYNIATSIDQQMYDRPVTLNTFSKITQVPGKRMATVNFSFDFAVSDPTDLSVVPAWSQVLESCGFVKYEMEAGVSWITSSENCTTATVEIADTEECANPKQRVIKLSGCTGTATVVVDQVGNPVRADIVMQGQIESVIDRNPAFSSDNIETTTPDSVLGAIVAAGGYSDIDCNTINIALNNDVQMEVSPQSASGYKGAHIVNRSISAQIDPLVTPVATRNWYGQHINPESNLNPVYFQTEHFTFYCKQMQVIASLNTADRNGLLSETIQLRDASAPDDDGFYILMGISG